jgi:lipopolysaccharide/colanic/teichoic acid biosynthesis glycosyltransferase
MTTDTASPPVRRIYLGVKAVLDCLAALVLLVLFGPLLLLIALLIRLESRGPAIFRQQRVGQGGGEFTIFKFRTMRVDAPNLSTAEMQQLGIIPFTRCGPFLRKTSLDELPQLLNVLAGEMSFVGPRPALPSQTDVNTLREARGVHVLRPGITGLAQVRGRDEIPVEVKVGHDAEYLARVSLAVDLQIVLMTFSAVLTARGNK